MGCCNQQQEKINELEYFPNLEQDILDQRSAIDYSKCCCFQSPIALPQQEIFTQEKSQNDLFKIKSIIIVYNPFSGIQISRIILGFKKWFNVIYLGNGKAKSILENIQHLFLKKQIEIKKVIETPGPRKIIQILANDKDLNNADCVVAIGGDGTLKEVVEGLVLKAQNEKKAKTMPVGLIAGGTGNAFCATLYGLKERYIYQVVVDRIVNGKPRNCDLIEVDYYNNEKKIREKQIALSMLTWGVGVACNITAEKLRCLGNIRYDLGILYHVLKDGVQQLELTIDNNYEKKLNINCNVFLALNAQHVGDGLRIAPFAKVDNGKIDIGCLNNTGRCQTLDLFGKIKKNGIHIYEDKVIYGSAKKLTIDTPQPSLVQLDGENTKYMQTPVNINTLESILSLVC